MGLTKHIGKELNIPSNTTIYNLPKSILTAVSDCKSATNLYKIKKQRRQIYKKKYYKRNKKYIINKSKEYFSNHRKERKAYKRLVRKSFYTPDDVEGHGFDCFSCKKLIKNKHCLFLQSNGQAI